MPATVPSPLRPLLLALALALPCPRTLARANDAGDRFDAVAAFDEGRFEDALAALDRAPAASDLAYLRIRTLAELERYDEALAKSEEPLSDWPDAVVRELAELRVDWAARAGRCEAVAKAQGRAQGKAGERHVARCAFASGDYARVKQLLSTAKDSEGRSLYIRALIALGEDAAATPLARDFYVDLPAHRDSDTMQKFLEKGGPLELTLEESFRRAEGYLSARDPESAYAELEKLPLPKDKAQRAQLWHLRGETLFRTRKRYPDAHKAFSNAAKLGGATEDYDAFHAARSTSRAGDDKSAIKAYRAFAAKHKNSKLTPDALYLAAWLSAREKLPGASKDLQAFVTSKHAAKVPDLKRAAIWHLGFHALEKKSGKEASKWLLEYERAVGADLERARAIYWQGRAALLEKDEARAKALFERAIREDRLGWYAQMAARRLMELGVEAPRAFEENPTPLPMPATKDLPPEVEFYRELGLYADAADAASRFLGRERDRARRAAVLREAGEANRLFVAAEPLTQRALEGPPVAERRWIWEALLPQPYLRVVREQTSRHDLDPSLFYGHMQTESHYKPRAVSSADAIGLMQLLPETAATVARSIGLKSSRSDLMRPQLNITLGAAYLGELVEQYAGQFPMAIAAYNAGTAKVDEWSGKRESELDLWVERIPVEQTRNYVRRVVTAWSRYHALTDPQHPWDLPLPAKVKLPARAK